MPERAKLRVLCLHSFRTSAAALAMQLRYAGLTGALEARCELVIRDAPHVLGEHEHELRGARARGRGAHRRDFDALVLPGVWFRVLSVFAWTADRCVVCRK